MKKNAVFYYESEKDDFLSQKKDLPKIDENYKYKKGFFGRIWEFFLHRIIAPPIAFPYIKLFVREKYYGKEKLKPYKKLGYFIYLNHTQPVADAVSPNVMIFPKKLYIIVNKENLALPVVGQATKYLGAIPLPDNIKAAKNFSGAITNALKKRCAVAIYPEAHVWPFYTGIREFGAENLEPAVKNAAPVFTATRVYRERRGKKPRQEIYIDGPFFPDGEISKREAREKLRLQIFSAMQERAKLSDCEWIKYVKQKTTDETKKRIDMINILVCGNRGVFDGMLLTVLSIIKHTERPINFFIGTMDISDIDPRFTPVPQEDADIIDKLLKAKNPESSATLVDFEDNFRRELINSKNIKTGYTPYAMIRLFADECELLPDKLLYLDTDVLLSGDIGEFYDIDVENYDFAGVRDHYGRFFIYPNYLNSGVMLWNLKAIREKEIFRRATKLCKDRRMLLMDQTAINKYAKKKLILPTRFNEQHKNHPDTLVRHFSMRIRWFPYIRTENIKPWNFDLMHKKLKLYEYDDIFEKFNNIKKEKENELKSFAEVK